MSKQDKQNDKAATLALRDGFKPEDAKDVELSAKWYKPEPGSAIHFLALERSDDVSSIFPDKDEHGKPKPEQKPKFVWKCELMGPAVLMQDQELVQGRMGDLFLMFEPSRVSLKGLLRSASETGAPITLVNKGKKSMFVRSQGVKREVWDYGARITPKRFAPLSIPSTLSLPSPEQAARLPEDVRTAGDTDE